MYEVHSERRLIVGSVVGMIIIHAFICSRHEEEQKRYCIIVLLYRINSVFMVFTANNWKKNNVNNLL
jgi:hypothetical protein